MSAAVIGRASAAGMLAMAMGFLVVGAALEAAEGVAAAVALAGLGRVRGTGTGREAHDARD